MSIQCIINQPIKLPFLSTNLVTGLTSFLGVTVLVNGSVPLVAPTLTYTEVGNGMYTLNVTPGITGNWSILIEKTILSFSVVVRDNYTILRNLEDECLGSWTWDKTSGLLTALRQDGTTLATFTVSDTLENASKERIP